MKRNGTVPSEAAEERPGECLAFLLLSMVKKLRTMEKEHFPLSAEQERERLARWLRKGELYDPRNDPDYDSWTVGMEPIPGDRSWAKENSDHETNAA